MKRVIIAAIAAVGLALPAFAEIDVQEMTSPGGIDAWLVEENSIPFVALEIRFKGGASLDAPDARGAINLMTALLEEGAGEMDSHAFSVAAESLAAEFRFDVHDDALSVSAKVLTENRDEAMDLLKQALINPRFDQGAIDRVRAQIISVIESDASDPGSISSQTYSALAFGSHPYGTSLNGTIESVAALNRDDVVSAHSRVMARDRLFVSAVGDINAEDLGVLLDDLLGGLPAEGAQMPTRVEYTLDGGVTVVDFETPQSVVTFGQRGLTRNDPDFFPAFVMTQILGGQGFSSRLMTEVREKRGLTYGIGTYLYPMNLSEMFLGSVSTANERVAETVEVVRAEWARLAEEGVTAEELERAQTFLTGAYPLRFDGNGRIANILVGMQMEGQTTEYLRTRNDKVRAVTVDDIRRVAAELVDPNGVHFVVVGKPDGLEATN